MKKMTVATQAEADRLFGGDAGPPRGSAAA